MIINGGSRSSGRFFARHLTNEAKNGRVELCEIRGLLADSVAAAFREMAAIASGTRAKNYFYHANINPRDDERLTPEQWERAADLLEKNLGLEGQPRFVVEHEKEGRIHRHIIWSRIDMETMKAISDSLTARIHEQTSRALEETFGLAHTDSVLVKGRDRERERAPEDWAMFRAQDTGIDPRAVAAQVTALWHRADSGRAFAAALEEHGYILAKGDRRDFVIIDQAGDEHSLARRIKGAKAADVRDRMRDVDRDSLPSVAEAKEQFHAAAEQRLDARGEDPGKGSDIEPGEQTGDGEGSRDRRDRRLSDEEKRAARNAVEARDAGSGAKEPGRLDDDEKIRARDAIRDAERVAEHIGPDGIRHHGLGMPWWQHAAVFIERVFEQARDLLKGAWQSFVDWQRGPGGDGPDLSR